MTWAPQPEGLHQIIALMKESQSPNTAAQIAVHNVNKSLSIPKYILDKKY